MREKNKGDDAQCKKEEKYIFDKSQVRMKEVAYIIGRNN